MYISLTFLVWIKYDQDHSSQICKTMNTWDIHNTCNDISQLFMHEVCHDMQGFTSTSISLTTKLYK